jgi:hypothetical protein
MGSPLSHDRFNPGPRRTALLASVLAALLLSLSAARADEARIKDAFSPVAEIAAFLERRDFAGQAEFHRFVQGYGATHPLTILSWAPLVTQAERDGKPILRPTADDKLVPQEEREDYLPVLYQERFDHEPLTLGFDLQALPDRKAVIDRAREAHAPIAIQPPKRAFRPTAMPVYSILWPVYRGGAFIGVLAGLAPADKMLQFVTPKDGPVAVFSRRIDDPAREVPLMLRRAGGAGFAIGAEPLGLPPEGVVRTVRSFTVYGLDWVLVFDLCQ